MLLYFILARPCGLRILAPQPEIEPVPSAVKAQNSNHWTIREFPRLETLNSFT